MRAPYTCSVRVAEAFVQEKQAWIAAHRQKAMERQRTYTPAQEAALRARAAAVLPDRVAFFAPLLGVCPAGVRITGAERRFGSCSGKNRLCFSFRLMAYPPEAVDYVVVHELAHILHHDHSPAFYREIARVLPDYRARQALLRCPPPLTE